MKDLDKKILKINKKIQCWDQYEQYNLKKQQLKKKKRSIYNFKFPSTSKLFTIFLFLNCTIIEIFTCWATIQNIEIARDTMMPPDLSPLIALISSVVSETIGFAIYSIKAAKENCKGGIIYQQAMIHNNNFEGQPPLG